MQEQQTFPQIHEPYVYMVSIRAMKLELIITRVWHKGIKCVQLTFSLQAYHDILTTRTTMACSILCPSRHEPHCNTCAPFKMQLVLTITHHESGQPKNLQHPAGHCL